MEDLIDTLRTIEHWFEQIQNDKQVLENRILELEYINDDLRRQLADMERGRSPWKWWSSQTKRKKTDTFDHSS